MASIGFSVLQRPCVCLHKGDQEGVLGRPVLHWDWRATDDSHAAQSAAQMSCISTLVPVCTKSVLFPLRACERAS